MYMYLKYKILSRGAVFLTTTSITWHKLEKSPHYSNEFYSDALLPRKLRTSFKKIISLIGPARNETQDPHSSNPYS